MINHFAKVAKQNQLIKYLSGKANQKQVKNLGA
jgi:hypothetical protein